MSFTTVYTIQIVCRILNTTDPDRLWAGESPPGSGSSTDTMNHQSRFSVIFGVYRIYSAVQMFDAPPGYVIKRVAIQADQAPSEHEGTSSSSCYSFIRLIIIGTCAPQWLSSSFNTIIELRGWCCLCFLLINPVPGNNRPPAINPLVLFNILKKGGVLLFHHIV